ncbi:GNAT family N-acetyltransferase [Actinomadura kijaniata]|uniref:GNAT family N-acetyltransferase n=1 Tax=Actinomadura kijaniata TaxID=46161 RepID=UPI003F1D2E0D
MVTFTRYDGEQAPKLRDTVRQVHAAAYAERIQSGDPFSAPEAFMDRFDAYIQRDGFDLVIAYADDGRPIGQAWGWPLPTDTGWWRGLQPDPELDPTLEVAEFTREDGTRTFALSELMVDQAEAGHGLGHRLHDELLGARTEQRATLLVRPDNPAGEAYRRWGWQPVARLHPNMPNAPQFHVLILKLPLTR